MNFSFGSPSTTTGNTLGTATPSTGFSFGSGDTKPMFGGTGAGQGENKPAFSFTSPTTSAPAFGGFSFGSKTTTAAPSMFGTPAATTNSAFGASKPLSFGGLQPPPNQTVGSPNFGQPTGQPATQNLPFGAPSTQPPAFGTPSTQVAAPGLGGSLFGQTASTAATGFSFSTPATGFSAAPIQPTASPQASQPAFGLKPAAPAPAPAAAPAFGQTSAFGKPGTGFSFGQTATPATSAPASAAPTFGTQGATFGQTQSQPTAISQPSMSFGASMAPSTTPGSTGSISSTIGSIGSSGTMGSGGTLGTTGTLGTSGGLVSGNLGSGGALGSTGTLGTSGTLGTTGSLGTTSTGFSFGATTVASSQPSGLGFGTTGFGNTQQPTPAAQTKAPKLNFGTPTSAPALAASTAQPVTALGAVSAPQPTAVSFGATTQASGLKFGTPAPVAATTAPTTGLSFGTGAPTSLAATTAPVSLSLAPPAAAPLSLASSVPAGLSFTPATSAAVSSAATTSAAGISLLGKSTAATTLPSLTTATTTVAAAPPQPISSVTFAQLEESINKWTIELEEQEKTFINQATQINAWDRLLIANGEKIVELNDAVETVKNEQQSLEHELDFVLGQQRELEELLGPMEGAVQPSDSPRDPQRAHMYSLAENLDTQLRQMSEDLKEVIEHLNETNRSQDSNDPIVQIGRILNAHMSSMQWIDNSIAQISTKLDQLKATHDTLRRDNERSFQLTYN